MPKATTTFRESDLGIERLAKRSAGLRARIRLSRSTQAAGGVSRVGDLFAGHLVERSTAVHPLAPPTCDHVRQFHPTT